MHLIKVIFTVFLSVTSRGEAWVLTIFTCSYCGYFAKLGQIVGQIKFRLTDFFCSVYSKKYWIPNLFLPWLTYSKLNQHSVF